jgi:CheY-like chemotaxis protein
MPDRLTVLIIDDEPDVLALLRSMLEPAGFNVVAAGNARAAVERMQAQRPDLILTDIYMPDGDGFELMAMLRRARSDVPLIAISGGSRDVGQQDPLTVATALGAAAVIAKPFKHSELLEIVNRVIGGTVKRETDHGGDDGG